MKNLQRLDSFIDEHFISPKVHDDFQKLGRARFIWYAIFSSTFFVAVHWISIELSGSTITILKTLSNSLGVSLGIVCLVIIKLTGNTKIPIALNLILGTCFVISSSYHSGGIQSVDAYWFIVLAMTSFMFVDRKIGMAIVVINIGIYTWYYLAAKYNVRDFVADEAVTGVAYDYVNLILILLFTSVVTYTYVNGLDKIKKELDAIKNKQVKDIGNKYKYITDNATDIIALHDKDGLSTYISPAVESILGYTPKEMLKGKYAEILNFKSLFENRSKVVECQNKEGNPVWLEVTYSSLEDELKEGNAMISIARDITSKILESKKLELLREQIANDFHDEMGNKLAAITLNTNVLSLKLKENKAHNSLLQKIEENSKSLYQNSRDFIWSIDPKSDRMDEIFFHLKDFSQDFIDLLPIEFESKSPGIKALEKVKLPMYWGRHIILIFKEGITNAVKHANCSLITLKIEVSKDLVQIQLIDNGTGFDNQKVKAGRGINSMNKRAKSISCNLTISSEGPTKLTFIGKLPKQGRPN